MQVTNEQRLYSFERLAVETYVVSLSLQGSTTDRRDDVRVEVTLMTSSGALGHLVRADVLFPAETTGRRPARAGRPTAASAREDRPRALTESPGVCGRKHDA